LGKALRKPFRSDDNYKSDSLLEKPYEILVAYVKVVNTANNEEPLEAILSSIDRSPAVSGQLLGHEWLRKLLLIGLAAKFPATPAGRTALKQTKKLKSIACKQVRSPIVIVAGGCSTEVEVQMSAFRGLILEGFRDFEGTIISGGTTSGISGLVGEAQQKNPNTMQAIGYVPKTKTDLLDNRYSQIRFTDGKDFSLSEPLQYWIDIIALGIKSSDVKLLGINGGRISAFEYRFALALEASVAIVKGSGMEADKLFLDKDWNKSRSLVSLASDPVTVRAFLMA
jgi:hypothetical protein